MEQTEQRTLENSTHPSSGDDASSSSSAAASSASSASDSSASSASLEPEPLYDPKIWNREFDEWIKPETPLGGYGPGAVGAGDDSCCMCARDSTHALYLSVREGYVSPNDRFEICSDCYDTYTEGKVCMSIEIAYVVVFPSKPTERSRATGAVVPLMTHQLAHLKLTPSESTIVIGMTRDREKIPCEKTNYSTITNLSVKDRLTAVVKPGEDPQAAWRRLLKDGASMGEHKHHRIRPVWIEPGPRETERQVRALRNWPNVFEIRSAVLGKYQRLHALCALHMDICELLPQIDREMEMSKSIRQGLADFKTTRETSLESTFPRELNSIVETYSASHPLPSEEKRATLERRTRAFVTAAQQMLEAFAAYDDDEDVAMSRYAQLLASDWIDDFNQRLEQLLLPSKSSSSSSSSSPVASALHVGAKRRTSHEDGDDEGDADLPAQEANADASAEITRRPHAKRPRRS